MKTMIFGVLVFASTWVAASCDLHINHMNGISEEVQTRVATILQKKNYHIVNHWTDMQVEYDGGCGLSQFPDQTLYEAHCGFNAQVSKKGEPGYAATLDFEAEKKFKDVAQADLASINASMIEKVLRKIPACRSRSLESKFQRVQQKDYRAFDRAFADPWS